jgi:hypothetical protein
MSERGIRSGRALAPQARLIADGAARCRYVLVMHE